MAKKESNVVRLENHYGSRELERAIARFVEYCNHERLHEAIGDATPDDMHHGRQRAILSRRQSSSASLQMLEQDSGGHPVALLVRVWIVGSEAEAIDPDSGEGFQEIDDVHADFSRRARDLLVHFL